MKLEGYGQAQAPGIVGQSNVRPMRSLRARSSKLLVVNFVSMLSEADNEKDKSRRTKRSGNRQSGSCVREPSLRTGDDKKKGNQRCTCSTRTLEETSHG